MNDVLKQYLGRTLLTSDLSVPVQLHGLQAILQPFLNFTSSQRGEMFASHIAQAVLIDGCEMPRIFTGYESKIGKYDFNRTKRNQDIQVVAVIPKFKTNIGSRQVRHNPTLTVIYIGLDDRKLSYFDISDYTMLSNGFGCFNRRSNLHELVKDNCIPKDMQFQTTPDHENDAYMQGFNVNVAYMPLWATDQDAFIVSQSTADKCEHTAIKSVEFDITPDDIPLNLYGDDDDFKIIPDIGEFVNDTGILAGFRYRNRDTILADITNLALRKPEYLHDPITQAPIGAQIVDIQVHTNLELYRSQRHNQTSPLRQLLKYQDQHNDYYNEVVNTYREYAKRQGYQISAKFNTLVMESMAKSIPKSGPQLKIKLVSDKDPIRFMRVKVTYAFKRKIAPGFKLSGRQGDKGIISEIWPDEDMPVDEYGIRSGIIIVPGSKIDRLNLGQDYEQHINRGSELITKRLCDNKLGNDLEAYNHILNYFNDIRPNYAKLVADEHKTDYDREEFIEACKADGLFICINGFTESVNMDMILRIAEKYDIKETPVSWNIRDENGNLIERVTSVNPISIGSKYMYLLGKIPLDQLLAAEVGFISQFGIPIKPNERAKNQSLVRESCVRFGEDEHQLFLMSLPNSLVARNRGIYSGSLEALNKLNNLLLTNPKPTALPAIPMTTREIIATDRIIALFNHQIGATGFDVRVNDEEVPNAKGTPCLK